MAKASLPPFIVWRGGRPRFNPGPRERNLGFTGEDLRSGADGRWFTFEEARAWGNANYERILEARRTGRKVTRITRDRSVAQLLDDWLAALTKKVERGDMSAATYRSYVKAADAIRYKPRSRSEAAAQRRHDKAAQIVGVAAAEREREPFAQSSIEAIGAPELRDFFDYARDTRGHHMALAMIAAVSAAWTWGQQSTAWRLGPNPRHDMAFERPDGRVMLIPLAQFHHIVAAADLIGRPSIGDSWYLGLFTGQRQTDRRELVDRGLIDGRRQFEQSKTGVVLRIKEAPQLTARLDEARRRVAALKLKRGTRPDTIVVDEATGLPYKEGTYRHWVGEVRRAAVHGVVRIGGETVIADPARLGALDRLHNQIEWLLPPMPDCADKRDQDLRDTCVILMYRGMERRGAVNLKAICDVTGHSYASVETIVKHYLGRDPERSDGAIDALSDFIEKEIAG